MDQFRLSDESTDDFKKLQELQLFNKVYNTELMETIDLMKQTVEQLRNDQVQNQDKIKQSLDAISTNCINVEYANLREKYQLLQTQFNEITQKYEKAISAHSSELEELKKRHEEDLEALKVEYSLKNTEYDETIAKLKEEIEVKEEEYLHDIHTSQAESALRFDEMESRLQKLLDTSNQKIRELNNSNNVLRSEMMSLKNDFTTANSTKIQELESRLIMRESQLRIAEAKLLQREPSTSRQPLSRNFKDATATKRLPTFVPQTKQTTNQHSTNDYLNPLPISAANNDVVSESATVNLYKETKKTCWVRKKIYQSKENLNVPQMTNAPPPFTNCQQVKRRKLHSLNDVDHLEDVD